MINAAGPMTMLFTENWDVHLTDVPGAIRKQTLPCDREMYSPISQNDKIAAQNVWLFEESFLFTELNRVIC